MYGLQAGWPIFRPKAPTAISRSRNVLLGSKSRHGWNVFETASPKTAIPFKVLRAQYALNTYETAK